jgi:hypothetical protein
MRRAPYMPSGPGRGRRFQNDSFSAAQIRAFQDLPPEERPAPPPSHGMSITMHKGDLEARDKETGAWTVPTPALERLAKFLGVLPERADSTTEGAWRHDLLRAIMREEKRISTCPRAVRWQRPGD